MYTWTLRRLSSCSPTHFSVSPTSAWRAPVRLWVCSCFSLAFNPTWGRMCARVGGGIVQKKCSHSVDSQVQNSCRFLKKQKQKKTNIEFSTLRSWCACPDRILSAGSRRKPDSAAPWSAPAVPPGNGDPGRTSGRQRSPASRRAAPGRSAGFQKGRAWPQGAPSLLWDSWLQEEKKRKERKETEFRVIETSHVWCVQGQDVFESVWVYFSTRSKSIQQETTETKESGPQKKKNPTKTKN